MAVDEYMALPAWALGSRSGAGGVLEPEQCSSSVAATRGLSRRGSIIPPLLRLGFVGNFVWLASLEPRLPYHQNLKFSYNQDSALCKPLLFNGEPGT